MLIIHKLFIHKLRSLFRLLESSLLISCLFSLIALTVLQIVLRNFFDSSISWIEPLNQHLVLLIAFLGAMVAGRKGEHIAFDVLQHYLPKPLKRFVLLAGALLSALVCTYLAYICAQLTYEDYLDPMFAFGQIPQWWFEVIIPIGFLVIAYRLLKVALLQFVAKQTTKVAS